MKFRPSRPQAVALILLGLLIIVGAILLIIGITHGDPTKNVIRPGDPNGMLRAPTGSSSTATPVVTRIGWLSDA